MLNERMRPGSVATIFGLVLVNGIGVAVPYVELKTGCVPAGWQADSKVKASTIIR